jgi:Zn-dependent peptidase ImmA (M78 family)
MRGMEELAPARRRSLSQRLAAARHAARLLLRQFGVEEPHHIQLEEIARARGAMVIDDDELMTAEARIVRGGTTSVIRLSSRMMHSGRRRFSLAHELGHLELANGRDVLGLSCDNATNPFAMEREAEADAFAAELLMPEWMVRRRCEVSPVTLDIARDIAATFRTSIVASAFRLVELTSERCALVYSEEGAVRWSARSATFQPLIDKGARLDPASVAYDVARGDRHHHDEAQPILAEAWIDTMGRRGDLIEHSITVPETDGVLTLLWVPEAEAARLGLTGDDWS